MFEEKLKKQFIRSIVPNNFQQNQQPVIQDKYIMGITSCTLKKLDKDPDYSSRYFIPCDKMYDCLYSFFIDHKFIKSCKKLNVDQYIDAESENKLFFIRNPNRNSECDQNKSMDLYDFYRVGLQLIKDYSPSMLNVYECPYFKAICKEYKCLEHPYFGHCDDEYMEGKEKTCEFRSFDEYENLFIKPEKSFLAKTSESFTRLEIILIMTVLLFLCFKIYSYMKNRKTKKKFHKDVIIMMKN